MKYSDEQIDLFLDMMGVELLPYQKEIFKKLVNMDKPVYLAMPTRVGFCEYGYLREMLSV